MGEAEEEVRFLNNNLAGMVREERVRILQGNETVWQDGRKNIWRDTICRDHIWRENI